MSDLYICDDCILAIHNNVRVTRYKSSRIISIYDYHHPLVEKAIKTMKYKYVSDLSIPISNLIIEYIDSNKYLIKDNSVLVPIPIHKSKYRTRGFNQSYLIAKQLSLYFKIPILEILTRLRNTKPQSQISNINEKRLNVQNAFSINRDLNKNNHYLLVDDVYTSGSTIKECISLFNSIGINNVDAIIFARGLPI